MINHEMYKKLYRNNPERYILKIAEELSEASVAIIHNFDDKNDVMDVIDELVDLDIQYQKIINYLMLKYGFESNELGDIIYIVHEKKMEKLGKIIGGLK